MDEKAIDRAERIIAATRGELSYPENETFRHEFDQVFAELDRDADELKRLTACLAAIAAVSIGEIADSKLEPLDDDEEPPERRAERHALEVVVLATFAEYLRELGP